MANYLLSVRNYLLWLFFILTSYSLSRLIFLFCNWDYIGEATMMNFLGGIRFDLGIIALWNLPFTLLICFPYYQPFQKRPFQNAFLYWNLIALAFNFIDAAYFAFTLKRTTSDLFITNGIGHDIITLLPSFIADFWYLFILFFLTAFVLFKLTKPFVPKEDKEQKKAWLIRSLFYLGLLTFSIIAYRGGLQLRPISVATANSYGNSRQTALILNTPFTIIRTATQAKLKAVNYFPENKINTILPVSRKFNGNGSTAAPKNVVLIILESFGEEYIGKLSGLPSYTPFLDSLIPHCTRAERSYANGRKSIEAMPSITASIPALMETALISSRFAGNAINALPDLLNRKGYQSAFFHGGTNGTMGFDVYADLAGYQEYYGKNEYPDQNDYDGNWGIPDEPYLQYFSKTISGFKQPFFATVFTLSSHHPFNVPKKYKDKFPKGELPIHQAVGYTDLSLRNFFETAKKQSWYNNTLFVITADHTSLSKTAYYTTGSGTFAIPILFYEPGKEGEIISKTAQQIDITPSVLDWLGIKGTYTFLGKSLLEKDKTNYAISYLENSYQLLSSDYLLRFDGEKSTALFNLTSDSLLNHNLVGKNLVKQAEMEKICKAYIQQYNNRLMNNTLTRP